LENPGDLKRGIEESLIFYGVGSLLTGFAYVFFENNVQAPNLYLIIALVFVVVGCFVGILSLFKYILLAPNQRLLGVLMVHSFALITFLLLAYFALANRC
jgi:hypothetical protein